MTISDIILLFYFFSIIGYIYEVILHFATKHKFIHSGILTGPYCFIYGLGVVILTLFSNSPLSAFSVGVITCFILELSIGIILDCLHLPRWDYSQFPYSIKGLTCLYSLEFFGILSVVYYNIIKDFIVHLFIILPEALTIFLVVIMSIIIIFDIAYTYFKDYKII